MSGLLFCICFISGVRAWMLGEWILQLGSYTPELFLLDFRIEPPPMTFHLKASLPCWDPVLWPHPTSQGVFKDK